MLKGQKIGMVCKTMIRLLKNDKTNLQEKDDPMTPKRMVELITHFYAMGLMRDQGGGIAVRIPEKKLIYCSSTQIQKEQCTE